MGKITKAVIPAAGMGTRFLPATKAMPKEMLPIVDKPVMQFVVEEAVNAGVPHILMVTGRNKNALENHFDRAFELEETLGRKGEKSRLDQIMKSSEIADIHYVRQGNPLGLGHAVGKAKSFVGNEAFALLLGDEVLEEGDTLLSEMIEIAEQYGVNVVALMEVPSEQVSNYGIADVGNFIPVHGPGHSSKSIEIKSLVEKPNKEISPSNFAVIGRYVLQPEIFHVLESLSVGLGGEIQLTDALSILAKDHSIAGPVIGLIHTGRRYDMGNKLSFLQATVELAIKRKDIGSDFSKWLSSFAKALEISAEDHHGVKN